MSLVHPSIIGILNRRFVSTYYNTFPGPGHDDAAMAFATKVMDMAGVSSLNYGAVVRPDGTLVNSFGFDMKSVALSLAEALRRNPRYAWMTPAEREILRAADLEPRNAKARLAAAKLWSELLQFDRARALLGPGAIAELPQPDQLRLRYERAHLGVLDIWADWQDIAAELRAVENPPSDLADDISLDLIALQIEENPVGAFFTGSRMRPGSDAEVTAHWLETYLDKPAPKRGGEAMFYLGVARSSQGDLEGANRIWRRHFNEMPEDRLALASRLHESGYAFSPNKQGQRIESIQVGDPSTLERLEGLLQGGGKVKVMGSDGNAMTIENIEDLRHWIKKSKR